LLRNAGAPYDRSIPEELKATMLFEIAGDEGQGEFPLQSIPPPQPAALPTMELFEIVPDEQWPPIPPPRLEVLAVIVLFETIGEEK
jgi:hypothetical protein